MEGYNLSKKRKGRRNYNLFGLFNEFSYTLIVGNVIVIYLIKLNASNSFIGLISSFSYISFFFIIFGKRVLKRLKIVRTMGWTWLLRNTVLLPMIFSPYFASRGNNRTAASIIFLSLFLFHMVRGIGLVGNSPLVGELSAGKDRGKFLSTYQTLVNISVLLASVTIVIFLKPEAPLFIFSIFFILGITTGFIGTGFLFTIPEPEGGSEGVEDSLINSLGDSLQSRAVRKFLYPFALFLFTSAMATPFILVYAKEIFLVSDRAAMIFSIIGTIGTIFMGLMSGFLLDRIGAKPLILVYTFITGISLIPGLLPAGFVTANVFILIALMFFLFQFGSRGAINGCQTYFYSLISQRDQVNLGILYFFIMGITGALGSITGGWYLDILRHFIQSNAVLVYRIFFSTILGLLLVGIVLLKNLESKGAKPLPKALRIMFSVKDLRAISLLNKLENVQTVEDEQKVIREIGSSQSSFPEQEVLKKLTAPSFAVRSEALYALSKMKITEEITRALLQQIDNYHFTTASIAARICGQRGIEKAVPTLRQTLDSSDYLLISKAILSLAQLEDEKSLKNIEKIVLESENPMVLIHGISALKYFNRPESMGVLFSILTRNKLPMYLREEIFVSLAGLLNFENWFYKFYLAYRESQEEGIELLLYQLEKKGISQGIDFSFITEDNLGTTNFTEKASAFLETMSLNKKVKIIIKKGLEAENIAAYKGLSFLIASFIVYNYVK